MRNKKGFTLIELLAIIVILAIIAVITVPIILGIIDDAKKGTSIDSAYGYVEGVDLLNVSKMTKGEEVLNGIQDVSTLNDLVNISGDKPVEGYVELYKGEVIGYSLKYGDYVVTLDKSTGNVDSVKSGDIHNVVDYISNCGNYNPTDEGLFTYTDYGDYIEITGYTGNISDVRIPCSINGKTVLAIGPSSFRNNILTSLVVPSSVDYIGPKAFSDNQLVNVIIGNGVTTIGSQAFSNNNISNLLIGNSVTTIDMAVFTNNQLTSITIPDSVTSIGDDAFRFNQLTSVTIGTGVTSIGRRAFSADSYNNSMLTTIYNNTGRSFDWNNIITGSSGSPFITGTVEPSGILPITITTSN